MRKYTIIAKVDKTKFVKYRTNHIQKTIDFLIKKFGDVYYANIYYKTGINKGLQLGSYGKNKGLILN